MGFNVRSDGVLCEGIWASKSRMVSLFGKFSEWIWVHQVISRGLLPILLPNGWCRAWLNTVKV